MKRFTIAVVLFVIGPIIFGFAGLVSAQDIQNFSDKIPSEQDFIEALKPKTTDNRPKIRSRGLRPIKPQVEVEETEIGASVELTFDFDSDRITPKAKTVLDNLGVALQDKGLEGFAFRIEGYTDSSGAEDYNMDLSSRRANAVKQYLVKNFNVAFENLESVGKGETNPLDPLDPDSPKNRRVQILNIGRK